MANHTGWEELASENERLAGLADSHDRVPAGTAMSAAAAGPAAHGAAKTAGGGGGSLATGSPSSRTRSTFRLRQYLKGSVRFFALAGLLLATVAGQGDLSWESPCCMSSLT
jgi:hypothetical protein